MSDSVDERSPCAESATGVWADLTPPYATLVADPPWHYDQRVIEWGRSKPMPYSTMTVDAIKAMSVRQLAAAGAHLYLWTTNRYLERRP